MDRINKSLGGRCLNYRLKLAVEKDCELLFKWTNDEKVRENSFSAHKIEYEVHKEWFFKKLYSENSFIFICYWNENPVGQVRVDITNDHEGIISYSVDCNNRNKGIGKNMLTVLENYVLELNDNIESLVGYVKFNNEYSKNIFKSLGYTELTEEDKLKYYKIIR